MKRKLDANDQPVPASETHAKENAETTFADFGLDSRLLQAVARQSWREPTPVQKQAIPHILEGGDVLAKSKTGSGKTGAYVLPILETILRNKKTTPTKGTQALVLVPTRELADQVLKNIEILASYCTRDIQAIKLSDKLPESVQRSLLANSPDVVVATPSRLSASLTNSALVLDQLKLLVLDEADLLQSYGYLEDLQSISSSIPKTVQTVLTSATLTAEVNALKDLFCRNPTVLDLTETETEDSEGLTQYVVRCGEDEKFLLIYVMIKLKLIKGKLLIFVANTDRAYRLRLYFEQFGLRSCVLNEQLPVNSRLHIVEQFNQGIYDIIIASDEKEALGQDEMPNDEEDEAAENGDESGKSKGSRKDVSDTPPNKKRKSSRRQDKEYGVSRGIDFKNVAMVINFDAPVSAKSYQHRIGRTARAGATGTALTFIVPKELWRKHIPTSVDTAEHDEKTLSRITKKQAAKGKEIKPWAFDMQQIEAFRYRVNDALRAVTGVAVREARVRELRQELQKSEKLSRHWEENPQEMQHLRHHGQLRTARTQAHLKNVPDYLLPMEGKKALTTEEIGFVPMKKVGDKKGRKGKMLRGKGKRMGRRSDPLRSFKARSKPK
ncbi:ATP-dependent RNA helicase-like protein dbp9 [Xylariaceae sp. FL0016]|nr:ATP-dependent RNA helicase-like protein dbp9 [Xylariaceae sp. FL0016]